MAADGDDDRWVVEGIAAACEMLDAQGSEPWQTSTLAGTGGGGVSDSVVVRFESPRRTAIAKLVRRNDVAPEHPVWWRRELEVYRSQWLAERMPVEVGLPECLGSMVTDDAAIIVMPELSFDRERRTTDWYGDLAVGLGQLNGQPADPTAAPSWATRQFLEHEADVALSLVPDVVVNRSFVIADLIDLWRPLLERFTLVGRQLVDELSSFPIGVHHLDAFSRNAVRTGQRFVLIDWAYTGLAPIGCDAAALIAITALHGDVPGARLDGFHEAVLDGYDTGLRYAGVELPPEDLGFAVDAALTLRLVRFLTQIHGAGDGLGARVKAVSGRPLEDSMRSWTSLAHHLMPSAERAFAGVGG